MATDADIFRLKREMVELRQALDAVRKAGNPGNRALSTVPFLLVDGSSIPGELANAQVIQAGTGISVTGGVVVNTLPAGAGYVAVTRLINTTAPLTGGGDLSADRTLALTTSPAGQTPVGVTRAINTTAPLTGGGDLSADRTLAVSDADASNKGIIQLAGALGGTAAAPTVAGRLLSRSILTTAVGATYTVPANVHTIRVMGQGAGGGGGGVAGQSSKAAAAGGGGAGGFFDVVLSVTPALTATYTVGAGGAGGTAGANPGSASANDTTFQYNGGTTYTAAKGNGGGTATAGTALLINAGGAGGSHTNGDMGYTGQPGFDGLVLSASVSKSGNGAPSFFGGGGAGRAGNGAGNAGTGYGSGGSGANEINNATNVAGGDGAAGVILIEEYS